MSDINVSPEVGRVDNFDVKKLFKSKEVARMEVSQLVDAPEFPLSFVFFDGKVNLDLVTGQLFPHLTVSLVDTYNITNETLSDLKKFSEITPNQNIDLAEKKYEKVCLFLGKTIDDISSQIKSREYKVLNDSYTLDDKDKEDEKSKFSIAVKRKELALLQTYGEKMNNKSVNGKMPSVFQVIQSDVAGFVSSYINMQKEYLSRGESVPSNISSTFDRNVGFRRQLMYDYLEANKI